MSVFLVRHTRVQVEPGVCYGRSDYPLASSFEDEAEALREQLPDAISEFWSSPAPRCISLGQRWAELEARDLQVHPDLQELNFGAWEGKLWREFRGPESDAWAVDPWTRRPPGGESAEEMWLRVEQIRTRLLVRSTQSTDPLAVITHAGVIRFWRAMDLGRPPTSDVFDQPVGYGTVWASHPSRLPPALIKIRTDH